MAALKIVHLLPGPQRCESSLAVRRLLAGLSAEEFVQQVCFVPAERLKALPAAWNGPVGLPAVCPVSRRLDLFGWRRLGVWLQAQQADVVHVWSPELQHAGAALSQFGVGAPRVVSDALIERSDDVTADVGQRLAVRSARAVVVRSDQLGDCYAALGVRRDRLFVVPPPAVPMQPTPTARDAVRTALGLPASARLIVGVGQLRPHKRFKDLIWAADLLKVIRDDVYLLIVGCGPQRWRLGRFRRQCLIEDKVLLYDQREDLPQLLAAADLFWLGAQQPSASYALVEALASGLPCVVADTPAHRTLIEPNRTGLLFPPGNRAQLARLSQHLLEDPQRRARLASAGQADAIARFPLLRWLEAMAAVYRQAAGG